MQRKDGSRPKSPRVCVHFHIVQRWWRDSDGDGFRFRRKGRDMMVVLQNVGLVHGEVPIENIEESIRPISRLPNTLEHRA